MSELVGRLLGHGTAAETTTSLLVGEHGGQHVGVLVVGAHVGKV